MPTIKFLYSPVLDEIFEKRKISIEVKSFKKELEKKWRKIEKKIFKEFSDLTGMKWKKEVLECYLSKNIKVTGISHPLILKILPDIDFAIANLIHELGHILLAENLNKAKEIKKKLKKLFPELKERDLWHLYLLFLELLILEKIWGKKKGEENFKKFEKLKGLRPIAKKVLEKRVKENLAKLFDIKIES